MMMLFIIILSASTLLLQLSLPPRYDDITDIMAQSRGSHPAYQIGSLCHIAIVVMTTWSLLSCLISCYSQTTACTLLGCSGTIKQVILQELICSIQVEMLHSKYKQRMTCYLYECKLNCMVLAASLKTGARFIFDLLPRKCEKSFRIPKYTIYLFFAT